MQPTAEQIKAASEVCADLVEQDPIGCWQDAPTEVIDSLAVLAKAYLKLTTPYLDGKTRLAECAAVILGCVSKTKDAHGPTYQRDITKPDFGLIEPYELAAWFVANAPRRLKPLNIPPMEMQRVIGYAECLPTCCIKTVFGSYHVVGDGWYFMSSDNRQRHVCSNELCVKEIVSDYERRVSELFEEAT